MVFKAGDPRPPNAGRKLGQPNKLTMSAKEAFDKVFQDRGGSEALLEWSKDNPTDFYKLYGKMIPTQQNATVTINHEEALEDLEKAVEGAVPVFTTDAVQ